MLQLSNSLKFTFLDFLAQSTQRSTDAHQHSKHNMGCGNSTPQAQTGGWLAHVLHLGAGLLCSITVVHGAFKECRWFPCCARQIDHVLRIHTSLQPLRGATVKYHAYACARDCHRRQYVQLMLYKCHSSCEPSIETSLEAGQLA